MIAAGHLTIKGGCRHIFDRTDSSFSNPATDDQTTCKICGFNWMTGVKFGPVKGVTDGRH
ncbi:MAG: hypothetical protein KDH96_07110 [Candidatus Riesia sp.]|nr:hypothetical protein [Candidatus Riesia sp.]